ncbi:hypothetical protein HYS28_00225 [Candidatus Uhrbacteria bacterium]|nr:hypothetical protein [Candidatus Uhrbacteria bacterium]
MSIQNLIALFISLIITLIGFAYTNGAAEEITLFYAWFDENHLTFVPLGIGSAFGIAVLGGIGHITTD